MKSIYIIVFKRTGETEISFRKILIFAVTGCVPINAFFVTILTDTNEERTSSDKSFLGSNFVHKVDPSEVWKTPNG